MTPRERLRKLLNREKPDRVPIWLTEFPTLIGPKEYFNSDDNIIKHLAGDPSTLGKFTHGWVLSDPKYAEVESFARDKVDVIFKHKLQALNRFLLVPPSSIRIKKIIDNGEVRRFITEINTPKGSLIDIKELKRNVGTVWHVKPPIESIEDVKKILSVPFKVEKIEEDVLEYKKLDFMLGEKGLVETFVSSPLVSVSGMMSFEKFLLWCAAERKLILELIDIATQRIIAVLKQYLEKRGGWLFRIGGCEQGTPPMLSPYDFDELVVDYDKKIINLLKQHGRMVAIHCHGKVRRVLEKFIKLGIDLIEPLEPPPNGDISFEKAKTVSNGRCVLSGNIEFDELDKKDAGEIRKRMKQLMKDPKDRIILSCSAGPISPLTNRQKQNYIELIRSGVEFGKL